MVGVKNGSIQDGISQGGVGKAGVPICRRDLGSDDGGRAGKAVIKHFQQVLCGWDWSVGARYFVEKIDYFSEAVLIVDVVGDADLNIFREFNSEIALCDQVWKTVESIGQENYFIDEIKYSLIDDLIPFIEIGIPACLLIDFDYHYWHTIEDTSDKVSPASLQKVGETLLQWLKNYLCKNPVVAGFLLGKMMIEESSMLMVQR